MRIRALTTAGIVGALVAVVCCAMPLLVILFGAAGLTAWLTATNYWLIPALIVFVALIAFGLERTRLRRR